MILQLAGRDPTLKGLPFVVGIAIVLGLLSGRGNHGFIAGLSSGLFVVVAAVVPNVQHSTTRFLAALPVRVRDVYAARSLVMALMVWLPMLTAGYWIKGIAPLQMAAFATFALLILQTVSIRKPSFPMGLYFLILFLLGVVPALSTISSDWMEQGRGITFTSVFVAASVVLFLWTWNVIPPSFLIAAGTRSHASAAPVVAVATPAQGWRSLLILYPWQCLLWIGVVFLETATGGAVGAVFVVFAWLVIQQSSQWVFALPIARRRLLPILVTPLFLACFGGAVVRDLLPWTHAGHPLRWRIEIVAYVWPVSATLLMMVVLLLSYWNRLQRFSRLVRSGPIAVMALCWVASMLTPVWWPSTPRSMYDFPVWLESVLPGWWLAVVALPAVLLYRAAEKLFREAEFVPAKAAVWFGERG